MLPSSHPRATKIRFAPTSSFANGGLMRLGFVVALLATGRLLVRPVLRYIAATGLREVFVGFALFLVLGTAAALRSLMLRTQARSPRFHR